MYQNTWLSQLVQKKESDKIQHPFMMKTLRKLGREGNFLNMIQDIYEKPTVSITLNGETESFFL